MYIPKRGKQNLLSFPIANSTTNLSRHSNFDSLCPNEFRNGEKEILRGTQRGVYYPIVELLRVAVRYHKMSGGVRKLLAIEGKTFEIALEDGLRGRFIRIVERARGRVWSVFLEKIGAVWLAEWIRSWW